MESNVQTSNRIKPFFVDEIKQTIQTIKTHANDKALVFHILTDSHDETFTYMEDTINNINEVSRHINPDAIIHLGDFINGSAVDGELGRNVVQETVRKLNEIKKPLFLLQGNHDSNMYYKPEQHLIKRAIQPDEWYNTTQQTNNSSIESIRDIGKTYFYVDYKKQKVRCIFLNSSDYPIINKRDGTLKYHGKNAFGWGAKQVKWLGDIALKNLGEDWGVLLFSHMPTRNSDLGRSTLETPYNGAVIQKILTTFINGSTLRVNTRGDWGIKATFDYTRQGPRELIASIYGHVHFDLVKKPSDLNYLHIAISNQKFQANMGVGLGAAKGATKPPRQEGTISQDLWDTLVLRRDLGKIYMIRFGAGDDREITIDTNLISSINETKE